jgi:Protein of unknown function (DUF3618)
MAQVEDRVTPSEQTTSHGIRAEIDRTRAEMDATVDAIGDKLTPGELLQEAWEIFRGGSGSPAGPLVRMAQQHPLPAALIGLGFGLMLYQSSLGERRSSVSHRPRDASDWYGDRSRVGDLSERPSEETGPFAAAAHGVAGAARARDTAESAVHKAGELAGQAGDTASDLAGAVKDQAAELGARMGSGMRKAQAGFWRTLDQQPFKAGIATLAIGVLAGLAAPASRKEDELMGDTRDQLLDQAMDLGREALEKGKQVAMAAAETLQQEAEAQGVGAQDLLEKARTIGREVTQTAKTEAQVQMEAVRDAPRDTTSAEGNRAA